MGEEFSGNHVRTQTIDGQTGLFLGVACAVVILVRGVKVGREFGYVEAYSTDGCSGRDGFYWFDRCGYDRSHRSDGCDRCGDD